MSETLWTWTASRLARAIREETLSSREVIQGHLDRIEAVNSDVNAITQVLGEEALSAADAADAAIASGAEIGLLHGLPITVKENLDVAGSVTSFGVVAYKDNLAASDAPVIQHLKQAGAIVIGRTNMPDFGLRWHTDNDLHGATVNPWNPARTPGGSSGGEAVALASGMSPLGIGNDMGGSTRQPAINCGVAGLRPTTGRVSRVMSRIFDDPPLFFEQAACVNGPMARSVADLRLALSIMEQADPSDPVWHPAAAPPPPKFKRHRIGLVREISGECLAPGVAKALAAAARALEEAGHSVEEVAAPLIESAEETIQRLYETELDSYLADILPLVSRDSAGILTAIIGERADAARYRGAIAERYRIAQAWGGLMQDYPLLLGPVSTLEPFEVGYDTGGAEVLWRLIRSFRLTELCNLIGLPSVAVPLLVHQGVPQGVQIIGRPFDDLRCLEAAELIERSATVSTPIDPAQSG